MTIRCPSNACAICLAPSDLLPLYPSGISICARCMPYPYRSKNQDNRAQNPAPPLDPESFSDGGGI